MNEPTKIETPLDFVARVGPGRARDARCLREASLYIADRDEQIAAWCVEKAAEAKREADGHDPAKHPQTGSTRERSRCEGQASFAEALAALLRGAK